MTEQTVTRTVPQQSSKRKVTKLRAAAFSLCDVYGGGYGGLQSGYLALFWTTFCGLTITQAQGIMGISTVLSAVMAIIIGGVSDNLYRTRFGRRFGRRRPLMLIGAMILVLAISMWLPGFNYGFYFVIFFLWTAANQVIMIPFYCLSSEMTDDFEERTELQTMRTMIPGLVNFGLTWLTVAILKGLGEKNSWTYTVLAIVMIAIYVLCIGASVKATWERTPEEMGITEAEFDRRQSLSDHLKEFGHIVLGYFTTLRIRAFQKHLALYLLVQSFLDVANYCFTFFVVYVLSGSVALSTALGSLSILGAVFAPIEGAIFKRTGVRGSYTVACLGSIASLGAYALLAINHDSIPTVMWIPALFILQGIWMFFRQNLYYLVWVTYPYLPDIDEIVTKERREGVYMGAILFFRRVTQGLAVGLLGVYLGSQGFDASAKSQPDSALQALMNSYVWIVVAGIVLVWIIALTYNLNKRTHGILVKEVERLKAGGSKADVDPETRKVVENLTGVRYEKCWPEDK
ncbi:MFS transporter [Bifidobacterium sp. MA2]|uniref:MFS transporter n=1 Tax=Bifidobacterium santillanense TaxID=2809028 RepID=A0ABS5UMW6_9BIFI|nr:MFS transporter [Bifidobacterium santillanense]MBT1172135.1 MFS transporter [Bifidobacterium santillanense]